MSIIRHEDGSLYETRWVGSKVRARLVREGQPKPTTTVLVKDLMSEPAGLRKGR